MRVFLLALFGFLVTAAFAEEKGAFNLTSPKQGYVIEKITHTYTRQNYTAEYDLRLLDYTAQTQHYYPEYIVAEHIKAIQERDYNLWLSTWDNDERKQLIRQHAFEKKTEDYWRQLWQKTLGEYTKFTLSKKVSFGSFVIVEVVASSPSGASFKIDIPLIRKNKMGIMHYYVTEKLKDHPLQRYWRQSGISIER